MKRKLAAVLIAATLLIGCTSQHCTWARSFLSGAQLGLPLFGQYAPLAQGVITTAVAMTDMLCRETDDMKAKVLMGQIYEQIQELNALGGKAGIR